MSPPATALPSVLDVLLPILGLILVSYPCRPSHRILLSTLGSPLSLPLLLLLLGH